MAAQFHPPAQSINLRLTLLCLSALTLAGCSALQPKKTTADAIIRTTPAPVSELGRDNDNNGRGAYLAGDGPGADVPANLADIADATPRAEPLHRYANRPYTALGKTYTPQTKTGTFKERGIASWYGKKFHGQRTSIGEIYDMYGMTAAHPTLPIPSYARVTNLSNNKSVILRINDRGPFLHDRVIDLSYTAAYKLDLLGNGSGIVEIESIAANGETTISKPTPAQPAIQVAALPPVQTELPAVTTKTGKVFIQLGAFGSKESANSFLAKIRDQFTDVGRMLSLEAKGKLTRVQYGPYATAAEARNASAALAEKLGFKPFVSIR